MVIAAAFAFGSGFCGRPPHVNHGCWTVNGGSWARALDLPIWVETQRVQALKYPRHVTHQAIDSVPLAGFAAGCGRSRNERRPLGAGKWDLDQIF